MFNEDLINIAKWFSYDKLVLNEKKTSSMLISSHQKRRFLDRDIPLLKFNDHVISSVTSDRFLGVIIDRSLIMGEHVNYLYNKLQNCWDYSGELVIILNLKGISYDIY